MVKIEEVKQYWEEHLLYTYEVPLKDECLGSFFDTIEKIKREDVELFTHSYWQFDKYRGRRVLDIGCGPGWLSASYARAGAEVYAVDITEKAAMITKAHLAYWGKAICVCVCNAESLSLADNYFDLVVASGVLHHTPDIKKAFREALRVLKPGAAAKITLYRKYFLHNKCIFPLIRSMLNCLLVPDRRFSCRIKDSNDFIRRYDGLGNPLGVAKKARVWQAMLEDVGFISKGYSFHYFPKRFLPFNRLVPRGLHRILERFLGTMVYFDLVKPT